MFDATLFTEQLKASSDLPNSELKTRFECSLSGEFQLQDYTTRSSEPHELSADPYSV